jgi:hypothetical protein
MQARSGVAAWASSPKVPFRPASPRSPKNCSNPLGEEHHPIMGDRHGGDA